MGGGVTQNVGVTQNMTQNMGVFTQSDGAPKSGRFTPKWRRPQNLPNPPQNPGEAPKWCGFTPKGNGVKHFRALPPPPKIMESHPEIMKEPKILEIHPRRVGGPQKKTVGNGPENGVERAEMSSIHPKI